MQYKQVNRISFDSIFPLTTKQPLERFFEYLPSRPFCMKSTKVNPYCFKLPKKEAIIYPMIQLNKLWRAYLCFDIDLPNAASAYKNAGLPKPTLSVVNPENGHAHVFYELLNPVTFTDKGRQKPKLFFLAIQEAIRVKLGADPNFNRVMAKNPFWNIHNGGKWELIINDRAHLLKDLSDHVDLAHLKINPIARRHFPPIDHIVIKGERNNRLFHDSRHIAYKIVKNHNKFEIFSNEIFLHCALVNQRFCKPPLSNSEIEQITKHVCNWTWENRLHFKNYKEKNRGVAGLDPVPHWMEESEWETEKKRRQRIGAKYTHSLRRERTEKAIKQAIVELKMEGNPVTKTAVAKKVGMTRENISRRYSYLFRDL